MTHITSSWLLAMSAQLWARPSLAQTDAMSQAPASTAKERGQHDRHRPKRDIDPDSLPADVKALRQFSWILGRPTNRSITLNVLAEEATSVYVEYGDKPGRYTSKTATRKLSAKAPEEITLEHLQPNQRYYFRVIQTAPDKANLSQPTERSFQTQRAPGQSFVFEIQGDSHPERPHQFDAQLYAQTLRAAATDKPDFYMTIGDDFSVDTLNELTRESVSGRYWLQRPFLSLIGQTAPIFLVNGNHEQASAANLNGSPDNVAIWAQTARNSLYPQPAPDGFYSGDTKVVPHIGLLRDYYAWTWGDALFVVIDPYWHSNQVVDNALGSRDKRNRDMWAITIGDEQYAWLSKTLQTSQAKYKFVFAHHVMGTGRGGIELANLYEWGGSNRKGEYEFKEKRPGWPLPIHQLMAKTGVTIFFQGHDHVFAQQELDHVIYQTLAQPADPNEALYNEQAYRSGKVLPNSGRVRVSVNPDKVHVEYVRTDGSTYGYEVK